jgi:hypothetical protein
LAEETEYTHPPAKRPPPEADFKVYWAWRNTPLPPRRATGVLTLTMQDVRDVGRKSWTGWEAQNDLKTVSTPSCVHSFGQPMLSKNRCASPSLNGRQSTDY